MWGKIPCNTPSDSVVGHPSTPSPGLWTVRGVSGMLPEGSRVDHPVSVGPRIKPKTRPLLPISSLLGLGGPELRSQTLSFFLTEFNRGREPSVTRGTLKVPLLSRPTDDGPDPRDPSRESQCPGVPQSESPATPPRPLLDRSPGARLWTKTSEGRDPLNEDRRAGERTRGR